jgi:hypothetical protein
VANGGENGRHYENPDNVVVDTHVPSNEKAWLGVDLHVKFNVYCNIFSSCTQFFVCVRRIIELLGLIQQFSEYIFVLLCVCVRVCVVLN